ncbi:MAG: UDP-N-acetylglucosamine 2-epimerase (non-hydrolyzing) [Bacteroidales bacterium]|jgi:UDP-GlcNAc3NAcA epimerase
MRICNIIGARPQIIKAAALSRTIRNLYKEEIEDIIIHTGQHYDANMSQIFFDEMDIPQPHLNLGIGSASHAVMTGKMLEKLESVFIKYRPDIVVLYGDTNSTLAGAVAAIKINIPIAHIEAGLRSFNKQMPEEVNRIVCDHCSTLLFTPTITGLRNLQYEGFHLDNEPPHSADNPAIYLSGDIMYDNSIYYYEKAMISSNIIEKLKLKDKKFVIATIHRNTNTDDPKRLKEILEKLNAIVENLNISVVFPLHPRTKKLIKSFELKYLLDKIIVTEPLSFFDMIKMENFASLILTDSGGVQKEAYFYQKPCIIMRRETEWVEILEAATGALEPQNIDDFLSLANSFISNPPTNFPEYFGNGQTAKFICEKLLNYAKNK